MCIRDRVRTNADTPHDAAKARELGAQGIGLCRTEHMFFEGDRIAAIREMICSDTVEQREKALAKLLPMQQGDFEGIYELSLIHISSRTREKDGSARPVATEKVPPSAMKYSTASRFSRDTEGLSLIHI